MQINEKKSWNLAYVLCGQDSERTKAIRLRQQNDSHGLRNKLAKYYSTVRHLELNQYHFTPGRRKFD